MHLNHPETIPPPQSVEKLPSTKLVLGAKKVGDCCYTLTMKDQKQKTRKQSHYDCIKKNKIPRNKST